MQAMVLRAREGPLILEERPDPVPGVGEIRIRVEACADAAFAVSLDNFADPVAAAPLLCAGLIGWRSLLAAGEVN